MAFDFTGTAVWRALISGPSPGADADAISVTDMGVLLADRTLYLYDRFEEAMFIASVWTEEILDPDSNWATQETKSADSWTDSTTYSLLVDDFEAGDRALITCTVTVEAPSQTYAEMRLYIDAEDDGDVAIPPSTHTYIVTGGDRRTYVLTHLTGPIDEGVPTATEFDVGLQVLLGATGDSIKIVGGGKLTVQLLRTHHNAP
jgi:hypothetical protein